MGVYRDQILPRVVDLTLRGEEIARWRRRAMDGMAGTVVEPGFGSGLNVPHYPEAVDRVYAVDPATLGRRLAADRVDAATAAVDHLGLDGQSLPLADDSCDAGLVTFTLCTIPDAAAALAELRRVIRPEGTLHFLEHGLSPEASVQRWQHRLEPIQKRVADGCHLTREAPTMLEAAGFEIDWQDGGYVGHPKPMSWFFVGRAVNV